MKIPQLAILLAFTFAFAAGAADRKWDQGEAKRRVDKIIVAEKDKVQAWERTAWLTSPTEAVKLAEKTKRPIMIFFYVDHGGPQASPC